MGREYDRYGWNDDSRAGWDDEAGGQRTNPGRGGASGGFGGSGSGWRNQGGWENDWSSGGNQQGGGESGWGGSAGAPGTYGQGGYGQPVGPSRSHPGAQSGFNGDGYGQPGAPSRPGYGQPGSSSRGGYGQPGGPSRGGYAEGGWGVDPADPYLNRPYDEGYHGSGNYGQPAPSSRSWQVIPSQPYEQTWNTGSSWGEPAPWGSQEIDSPTSRRRAKSHGRLWITLAVVAMLLVTVGVGGAFAVQYFGPTGTVTRFCGALKTQSYTSAYSMLSSHYQNTVTQDDFANDAATLDRAEGSVLDCSAPSSGIADNLHFGEKSAAFNLTIRRASAGTLGGILHLSNESGSWKVSALDTSLLGVNLGAIQAANAYCTALQSQAYSAAYAILGKSQTASIKQADYSQQGQWHDQVDGTVSLCQIVSVTPGSSDTQASLSASITRGKLGKKQDTIALDVENGAWKITAIGSQLQGTDIGGIQTTARLCSDLSHNNYKDLYNLLDGNFVGSATEPYIAELFDGQYNGIKFTGCTFDATTYKLSGSKATITAVFSLLQLATGQTANVSAKLTLVRYGHTWKLDDLTNS